MAIVNELVTSLEFKLGPRALETIESFKKSLNDLSKFAGKFADKGYGAFDGLKKKIVEVSDEMLKLDQKALTTGISPEAIQRWGHVAKVAGLSAEAIFRDLETLKLTEGIKNEAVIDVLNRLTAVGNDEGAAFRILENFKLSKDFYTLLKTFGGTEGLLAELEKARIIPDKDVENSAELAKNINRISSELETMKKKFIAGLAEPINEQLKKVQAFMEKHGYFEQIADTLSKKLGKGIGQAINFGITSIEQAFGDKKFNPSEIGETIGDDTAANIVTAGVLGIAGVKLYRKMQALKGFFTGGRSAAAAQGAQATAAAAGGRGARLVAAGGSKVGIGTRLGGIGAIALGTNLLWTEYKNIGKEERQLNWLEEFVNSVGLTETLANALPADTKQRLRIRKQLERQQRQINITNNNTQNVTVNPSTFSGGYGTMQALGLATAAGYNGNTILGTE